MLDITDRGELDELLFFFSFPYNSNYGKNFSKLSKFVTEQIKSPVKFREQASGMCKSGESLDKFKLLKCKLNW
jgi:hypothetical protein